MSAQQGGVNLAHGALAELVAKRGVNRLVTRNDHQARGAKIKAMHQRAARKGLHQTMVNGITVLRIFSREAKQAGRFVDQQQMLVLPEDLNVVVTGWCNKRIDYDRHQAARLESGCG